MTVILPVLALRDNYIWCMVNEDRTALVVDPGEATPVLRFLKENKLELKGILVTHHHYDHTNGIAELLQHKKVTVIGSAKIPFVTTVVTEDQQLITIEQPNLQFHTLTVPGHTLEHVAYYQKGLVFSGDTLFTAGCGKIFEGTAHQMYESLNKFKQLPDETEVYCGHEYTLNNLKFAQLVETDNLAIQERYQRTDALRKQNLPTVPAPMRLEKLTNPFLRCEEPDVIASASQYVKKSLTDPVEVFKTLREWKNNVA